MTQDSQGKQAAQPPIEQFGQDELAQLQGVRRLVDLFYDEMDRNPAFARIRQLHPAQLDDSREKFFLFLSGWLGGPDLYSPQFGHPRLRMRHMPFPIAREDRDQWLSCMVNALRAMPFPEQFIEQLMVSFFRTADWMRNQDEDPASFPNGPLSIRGQ